MDITNFIVWFVNQVVNIFTWIFSTLDNIKFLGTSLLGVLTTIMILSVLLPVILTLGQSVNAIGERSDKIDERRERNAKKAQKNNKSK